MASLARKSEEFLIVEIRTYGLKPGTSQEFLRAMTEALPLLAEAGLQVVAHGLSLVAEGGEESAYLIRAFDSLEQRDAQENEFYESAAWRQGPREAVISRIESMHTVVLEAANPEAFAPMTASPGGDPASDPPPVTVSAVVLGAPDARVLAEFYRRLLGWEVVDDEPDWVKLAPSEGGMGLSFQTEADHVPPVWPAGPGEQQMMMHLDIRVADLDEVGARAVEAGARPADVQPQEGVRVYLDPAGHPFCLFLPGW